MRVQMDLVKVKDLKTGDLAKDLPFETPLRETLQRDYFPMNKEASQRGVYGVAATLMMQDGSALPEWVQDHDCLRLRVLA